MRKNTKKRMIWIIGLLCSMALENGIPREVAAYASEGSSGIAVSGPLKMSQSDSYTYYDPLAKGWTTLDGYKVVELSAITINDSGGGGWSSTASGMVTGGQAYTELRTDGTFIGANTRTNANVTALDTALAKVGNEEIVASTDNDSLSVETTPVTDANGITTTTYNIKAKKATLTTDDTGLVTGGDAYDELRSGADGTRISSTSTTAANLTALDTQAKSNADQIEINEKDIQDLRDMKNLTEDGKTYIKNLAKEGVKVQSGNETIISVTSETSGDTITYSVTAHTGEIGKDLTTLVTGGKVYNEVHLASDGNYVKQSNSTAQNLGALDNQVKTNSDLIIDLDNRVGNKIQGLFEDLAQVGADASALSALRPEAYDPDDRWSFAVGYGHYKNRNAGAIGVFFKPDLDVTFSVGSTVWSGDPMMNVGASFRRKRTIGSYRTAQELTYRIRALEADETKRKETLATQIKRIEKAENKSFLASHRIAHLETVNQKLKEENKIRADGIAARAKEIAELQAGVKIIRANNEEIKADNAKLKQQIDTLAAKIKEVEKAKKKEGSGKKESAKAAAKPEAKVAIKTETKPLAKPTLEKGKKVEAKPLVKSDVKSVSKTVAKSDAQPTVKPSEKKVSKLARAIMRRKAQIKAKMAAKAETLDAKKAEKEEERGKALAPVSAKPETKAVAKTEQKPVAQVEMAKDVSKTAVKPEAKAEAKAPAKVEKKEVKKAEKKEEESGKKALASVSAKSETKAVAKTEQKQVAKSEAKAEVKVEKKAEAKAKSEVKPEVKPEAKAEVKSEVKAATEAQTKADAKVAK